MALDTVLKRGSAVSPGLPTRLILPIPDGTIEQGARQTVAMMFSGIAAAAANPITQVVDVALKFGKTALHTITFGKQPSRTARF